MNADAIAAARGIFVALSALIFCGTTQAQGDEFTLTPELVEKLKAHAPKQRAAVLARYASEQEIDHKGNFGKKVYADIRAEFVVLESGLIGARGTTALRSSQSAGGGRSLNLCGLLIVASESSTTSDTSVTTVIPIGNLFVPLGIKSSVDFNNRQRLLSLDTVAASLCDPSPGAQFAYSIEGEFTIKTSGMFGRTNTGRRVGKVSCQVGAEPLAASAIHPALKGDYLPVSCETENPDGKKVRTAYAFLRDVRHYLSLEQVDEWQTVRTRYLDIGLAAP